MDLLKEVMKIKTDGLFLCVLGPSGAGKSHFIGTYPGKTLFLYGAGESHGPASASNNNKDLLPISWDRNGDGTAVEPSKYLGRIKEILDPKVLKSAGIKCVALDSLTNLARDVSQSEQFKQRCTDSKGKHNVFKETEAYIELLSGVINKLQTLQDFHDIDVITTLDLNILSIALDGTILESKPGLPTFGVGKALIQQFPDILVLGRMGEKRMPIFQNMAKATSSSVDRETLEVIKYVEYNPRLRGVKELPETIEPTVQAIMALKEK